ncbi:MAG: ATP-dependent DNA helicase PcrA [Myxococcales bacterium]|nr:ATP-dependent DNA helicase PcrA [Myxococcales bacterium]
MSADHGLNPPQQEAVDHGEGPLLVLAGAGSGKTRVITHRLATLVGRNVKPWRILAVTFTNKAAGEMRARATKLLGDEANKIWISTFHSTCARLLRIHAEAAGLRPDFMIFDDSDQRSLVIRIMRDLQLSDRVITPRALLSGIDRAKNAGIFADAYQGNDYITDLIARVYPEFQKRLRAANAVDFGDLLLEVLRLTTHPEVGPQLASRFDHVLVDEFQDTNVVQYRIVDHLTRRTRNLCVVGDDDQAIYRWRGANVENILGFPREQPGCRTVKLEQNYRSTQLILEAANGVIARNRTRMEKRLFTEQGAGQEILYHTATDERREAEFVVQAIRRLLADGDRLPGDCAIFYRTHAQSRVIEEAMRAADLPYSVVGGTRFYDRAEVKDLLAYLRVIANPGDDVALERIVNVPTRGIGDTTIERVRAVGRAAERSLWEGMREALTPTSDALGSGPRRKLIAFVDLIVLLRERAASGMGLADLSDEVLEQSGYLERLSLDGTPEARDRIGNLQELVGSMRDYEAAAPEPSLVAYLERVALESPADGQVKGVALMTVHAAKGLEFPVVFVTGLEEGTFPRVDPDDDPSEMEEERRLAYVAITRARERLFLTNAAHRRLFGREVRVHSSTPSLDRSDAWSLHESRFIADIPAECIARPVTRRPPPPRGLPPARREERGGGVYVEREDLDDAPRRPAPPSPAIPGADRRVEYEDDRAHYQIGQRVRHSLFGVGVVRACTGQGEGLKLTVYFAVAGPKTVVARFVEPA